MDCREFDPIVRLYFVANDVGAAVDEDDDDGGFGVGCAGGHFGHARDCADGVVGGTGAGQCEAAAIAGLVEVGDGVGAATVGLGLGCGGQGGAEVGDNVAGGCQQMVAVAAI